MMSEEELQARIRSITLPIQIQDKTHEPRIRGQRPASVLIPFVHRGDDWQVIFTRRPDYLPSHAGQISFPGGRTEAGETPHEGALRELHEEIGVPPDHVNLLGRLSSFNAVSEYRVTPYVGIIDPSADIIPCENEVAEVFELPLSYFLDPANHIERLRTWEGRTHTMYDMPWPEPENPKYFIWGMTAMMLYRLYERGLRCS